MHIQVQQLRYAREKNATRTTCLVAVAFLFWEHGMDKWIRWENRLNRLTWVAKISKILLVKKRKHNSINYKYREGIHVSNEVQA